MDRTVPSVVDDYVEIGSFTFNSGSSGAFGGNLWITISMGSGFPVIKSYVLPIAYDQTQGNWQIAIPVQASHFATAIFHDFDLEINVELSNAQLRLRRSVGTFDLHAHLVIRYDGGFGDTFTETSGTGSTTPPTAFFTGSAITTVGLANSTSKTGIGDLSPDGILDIESTGPQTNLILNNRDTASGDPVIEFQVDGSAQYTIGVDDSDGNKFKISTGASLGPGDLITISPTGSVGLGITAPFHKLDIMTPINTFGMAHSNGNIELATYLNSTYNSGMIGTISFHPFQIYTSNAGPVATFSTGGSSTGKMGIRETSPVNVLDVSGAAVIGTGYAGTTVAPNQGLLVQGSVGIGDPTPDGMLEVRQSGTADIFNLYDGTTNVLSVLDGGDIDMDNNTLFVDAPLNRVGIGTSTPSSRLHVASAIQEYIQMQNTTSGVASYWSSHSSTPWIGTLTAHPFALISGNAFRLYIAESGDVGIGTITPAQKLHVMGNAYVSGSIGIGTTSPAQNLHVNGTALVGENSGGMGTFNVVQDGGTQGNVVINRLTTDGVLVRFRRDGGTQGTIEVAGATVSYNAFTGSHYTWSQETPETGMLVTMTGENRRLEDQEDGEIIYGIRTSTEPNDPKILGAFLARENPNTDIPDLVMAVGNGVMWIADNGEDTEIGDYLISSGTPGHAMKDVGQYDISYIVARAAEPVKWAEVDARVQGVKHKKISVLFESFTRNHAYERVAEELTQTKQDLGERIARLEKIIEALDMQ